VRYRPQPVIASVHASSGRIQLVVGSGETMPSTSKRFSICRAAR